MRRWMRAGSHSMQMATPSFMVTASGWAPPMPPRPAVTRDGAGQRAAELLVGHRGEGLEGALQDALGADVDPRAGRHLAVHGQAEVLEAAELLPVGPVADQVGVRDQHPRGPLVGAHDADRLAGLHQHRLVVGQRLQGAHERVVGLPAARGLARAAVDDELLGVLGDLGVEVVHQHPQRGLGLPRAGAQRRCRGRRGWAGARWWDEWWSCELSDRCLRRQSGRRRRRRGRRRPRSPGTRWRSGPGPWTPFARSSATTAAVAGAGSSGRAQVERAGGGHHLDGHDAGQPVDGAAQLAGGDQPIETWSSCMALEGMESTLAGTASRLSSETIAAWVYCAIISPLSTPGS